MEDHITHSRVLHGIVYQHLANIALALTGILTLPVVFSNTKSFIHSDKVHSC